MRASVVLATACLCMLQVHAQECFTTAGNEMVLKGLGNNPTDCTAYCSNPSTPGAPYTVIGMTGASTLAVECWCGFTFGSTSAVDPDTSLCTTACAAPDVGKFCGAGDRYSVYSITADPVDPGMIAQWNGPPIDRNKSLCFAIDEPERCNCIAHEAVVGMYRNPASTGLSSIGRLNCAAPIFDQVNVQAGCYFLNKGAEGFQGKRMEWIQCTTPEHVIKGWRNLGNGVDDTLDALIQIQCCPVNFGATRLVRGGTHILDVRQCMQAGGMCSVPDNSFLAGMFRGDCDGSDCIQFFKYVFFEDMPITAAPTPAPPTLVPTLAPPTTVPDTLAPATPEPTLPPATLPPLTDPPATVAPTAEPTPSPTTQGPTPVPPTDAPATAAPLTPAPLTEVPATAAPRTPAPPTDVPATAAPRTPAPSTKVPTTLSPPSPVPRTLPPVTLPPVTSVPATQVPETVAPVAVPGDTEVPVFTSDVPDTTAPSAGATSVPGTVPVQGTFAPSVLSSLVPVDDVTTEPATATAAADATAAATATATATETEAPLLAARGTATPQTAAPARVVVDTPDTPVVSGGGQGAAIAATVTMGASAGAATRLVLVSQRCTLSGQKELPLPLHPLRFHLGGSVAAGAVVGNLSICFVLALVGWLILFFSKRAQRAGHCIKMASDVAAVIRFPSIPLFAFQVLYQGTSFAGLMLLFEVDYLMLGVLAVTVALVAPALIFSALSDGGRNVAMYYVDPHRGMFWRHFAGRGEWLSLKREYHWVYRYASVMRSFRPGAVWFSVIEFAASFALASTQAFATPDMVACGHARLAGGCIFLIMFTLELYLKPHVRFRDNIIDPAVLLLQAVALFLTSAGYYMEDPDGWFFDFANGMFGIAIAVLMGKAVLDAFTECVVFVTRSRARLQDAQWAASDEAWQIECNNSPRHSTRNSPRSSDGKPGLSPALPASTHLFPSVSELSVFLPPDDQVYEEDAADLSLHGSDISGKSTSVLTPLYADLSPHVGRGRAAADRVQLFKDRRLSRVRRGSAASSFLHAENGAGGGVSPPPSPRRSDAGSASGSGGGGGGGVVARRETTPVGRGAPLRRVSFMEGVD